MINNNEINIRLELLKDKNTGKLSIAIRFDTKAPNVSFEKNEYIWMPTLAEKDLINDAFKLLLDTNSGLTTQPETIKEVEENKEINQPDEVEIKKENNLDIKVDVKSEDFPLEKNNKDNGIGRIDETGEEIIEESIEKHIKKEEPLKEADEHLIIEKVINQKKKGKWRKIQ